MFCYSFDCTTHPVITINQKLWKRLNAKVWGGILASQCIPLSQAMSQAIRGPSISCPSCACSLGHHSSYHAEEMSVCCLPVGQVSSLLFIAIISILPNQSAFTTRHDLGGHVNLKNSSRHAPSILDPPPKKVIQSKVLATKLALTNALFQ